jgi:Zn-dependent protease
VFGGGWRVGRIAGVDIFIHPSLLVIAGLLVVQRWTAFSERFPGLSTATLIALAVSGAVLFFASILAHELGHALVSKARHIPVAGITLLLFGGLTQTRADSKRPIDEFLITAVGPVTNGVLGVVFLLLRNAVVNSNPAVATMFDELSWINFFVAVFNLIPGFPMDGGRVFRSIVWRVTGNPVTATRVAARVGQVFAIGLIAWSLLVSFQRSQADGLWFAFIGVILLSGATAALAQTSRQSRVSGATAGDVMSTPPPAVPPDMPLAEARHRFLDGHDGEAFPVVEHGRLIGFVSPRTARDAPPDGAVRTALAAPAGVVIADRDTPFEDVIARLQSAGTDTALVFDDGRLVGVIEQDDIRRFLQSRG